MNHTHLCQGSPQLNCNETSQIWPWYSACNYPASIATLAQRQPLRWTNVGSQRWANVDLSIGPTVARQRWPNVVPTSAQRWHTNVGPTLAQRYANGCMPTLYQHWPNGGCVTGFLLGNPSVTDGFPSQRARNAGVAVCLSNRLNKQSSWVTGDLRHHCDRRQCNIHMSKDVTVLFRRCAYWSKQNVQKDNGLSLAGAKPILSEPTLVYIVNWTLANKFQWKFNRNSYICIQENAFEILSGPQWVYMNQVFMLVYSRSVTMPGLDQNWSLLPTSGWFRRKDEVVLANYGVKKNYKGTCVGPTSGRYRPCDVGPTSLRRWVDVARRRRPNIGSTSVTILEYYNQNKQKCSTTKRNDSFLSSKKSNNNNGSLHDACKSLKQM